MLASGWPNGKGSRRVLARSYGVQMENVDATVEKAGKMSGKRLMPKTLVPDMGHFAVLQDPTGGVFVVWAMLPKK